MPVWEVDSEDILQNVKAEISPLKIILKTKDESYFLRRWYEHHSRIVGSSNIIIMDNGSTKPECLSFYEEIHEQTLIFQFQGLHNNAHDTRIFSTLYGALKESSDHFIFIDSDEFLFFYDEGRFLMNSEIISNLSISSDSVTPCMWIENMPGSDRAFNIAERALQSGVRWGKPIISSARIPLGYINHNSQIASDFYEENLDGRFVILHLSKLFTKQRIDVNIEKLKQRGFFKTEDYMSEAMSADHTVIENRHIKTYVTEIQDAINEPFESRQYINMHIPVSDEILCVDMDSGEINFYDGKQRVIFESYASHSAKVAAILKPNANSTLVQNIAKVEDQAVGQALDQVNLSTLSMRPHMTPDETKILATHLKSAKFLLEFGSGGSTVLAAAMGVSRIHSIDSSSEWLADVGAAPEMNGVEFTAHYIDIGPLAKWGNPADKSSAIKWPIYYTQIWQNLDGRPDLVIVDGRFRVACTLMTLLKCSENTRIILHDFWSRPHYHIVLDFLELIERVDDIGVFYPAKHLDWRKVGEVLTNYVVDFR